MSELSEPNPWLPAADGLVTEDRLYEAICHEIRLCAPAAARKPWEHPDFDSAWDALQGVFANEYPSYRFSTGRVLRPLLPGLAAPAEALTLAERMRKPRR